MQYSTSVTQKGQATIPAPIRKKLGIQPNTKIIFEIKEDEVIIKPVPDFFSMKGSIKSDKPFDIDAMDQSVAKAISKEYAKELD
jgi:AbrB family looped-hinge helix DNA binding protein